MDTVVWHGSFVSCAPDPGVFTHPRVHSTGVSPALYYLAQAIGAGQAVAQMPPSDPPDLALSRAIRSLRDDRHLTQEDLAHQAGITWASLGRIERGVSNPTWTTIRRLATALDVTLTELVARVDEDRR